MQYPICQFCNLPIKPSWGFDCPNCSVSYHKKCIREITHCLTCTAELAPKEKPPLKPGEVIRIPDTIVIDTVRPFIKAVGGTFTGVTPVLFLFWNDLVVYILLFITGLFLLVIGKYLHHTLFSSHVINPAFHAVLREVSLLGRIWQQKVCLFEEIQSIRIEGEQRYFATAMHQLDYLYEVYWIAIIKKDKRHICISNEMRTDKDEDFKMGDEYNYGGLRAIAEKIAWATDTNFWVTPEVAPVNNLHGFGPVILGVVLIGLLILLGTGGGG